MPGRSSKFASLPFDPWPAVLPRTHDRHLVLPLALGLHGQLQARLPAELHGELEQKLRKYCRSPWYQRAVADENSQRHDIDGRPVEPVSEAHRESARSALKYMWRAANQRRERDAAASPPEPPKRPVLALKTGGPR
jgi:sRNA-binding protein